MISRLGDMIVNFAGRPEADLGFRLARLWPRWREVMGQDLAPWARPLGHKGQTLLLGVEDALAMQESRYDAPEVLERVNAFLGQVYFDKAHFDLLQGKTPLDGPFGQAPTFWCAPLGKQANLGGLNLDPNTAVGRCYLAYVRQFGPGA